ncbi:MAG TPA: chloride channel protein, partial [Microbacteriaceae bacterium]|nr:chloride channel protein [Microbacteriaceae bacterium]
GVPQVMMAVATQGSRIRSRVGFVKALASALCIGTGGSVGREGPIVQIGSSLASSVGQRMRLPEGRLRLIVACGAAGGIAATFNAPLMGAFFGFELILRLFSIDAFCALLVSALAADVIDQQFFGQAPFFGGFPQLGVQHLVEYALVAVLGVLSGLIGIGFKTVLYKVQDLCDLPFRGRLAWARPAIGGVALGALLFFLPQMYGVGYTVVGEVFSDPGRFALWLVVAMMAGKVLGASITLGNGGSGGVFGPSVFTGAMAGVAFGLLVRALFGPIAGEPVLYGMVAMGAVVASAAQAPLTAAASVVEMTGDFALTLPAILAAAIAAAVSKSLSYGTIYTTKLLRRGIDVEEDLPGPVVVRARRRDATPGTASRPPRFRNARPGTSAPGGETAGRKPQGHKPKGHRAKGR